MKRLLHLLAIAAVLLGFVVSCAGDATPATERGTTAASRAPTAALPASLRMAALRGMQSAAGHDFVREGETLAAPIGVLGAEAWAEIVGEHVTITPADATFTLGVRTTRAGRLHAMRPAGRVDEHRVEGQEAVLTRAGLEERYLAGPLGLEQSFRVDAPPLGPGPLAVEITFDGLVPTRASDAEAVVHLADEAGVARAVYRDVAAVDADGRELAARMELTEGVVTVVVEDAAAVYPVTIDPLIAMEQAKLTADDGAAGDAFAYSVAVSGDTAIVGACFAGDYSGAAYVFVRSGQSWSQQAKLSANDTMWWGVRFGCSVSVSGDTAVVGAYETASETGAAYVFVRSGTSWSEQAKLTASDGAKLDAFGRSVSVSGDTALVGANEQLDQTGAAYVFVRSGTSWSEQAKLTASDAATHDWFGRSVSLSGDTAVVGASAKTSSRGAAYVFVRNGASWAQQAKLMASDGAPYDSFADSVSVSGDTILAGSYAYPSYEGAAYVFERSGAIWSQQAKLTASDAAASALFGSSVSVWQDTAIIGASGDASQTGAAYVFVRSGNSWVQHAKITASDGAANDRFGESVSVSGDTALIGAFGKAGSTGAAYVFVPKKNLGEPCVSPAECASGFCADGVCCDSACDAGPCDACSVAAGAAASGTCALFTGPACDDGDACTQSDSCQAGVCVGSAPVVCAAEDPCHEGVCDPSTGSCSNAAKPDGTACDDGDACTQSDTCQAGVCTGTDLVVCTASDACHDAGTCDPTTGACSNPAKPNGTACDDGDACTQSDTCQAGVCTGTDLVVCTASDSCHDAGTCDPTTGACSDPAKSDGAPCDDGNACTAQDECVGGVCSGAPADCASPDECHEGGVCDPTTGACSNPAKADGTPCSAGTCEAGVCTSSSSSSSSSGSVSSSSSSSSSSSNSSSGDPTSSGDLVYASGSCACRAEGARGEQGTGAAWLAAVGLALAAARRRRPWR